MSDTDAELRQQVAAAHGLDDEAATFLNGTTVEQLETSAAELAKLIKEPREQAPAPAPDLFTDMQRQKAAKKQTLLEALTGRAPQLRPRDERGRFASTGFDGGARRSPPPPPEGHDRWLARLLRERTANSGARF